MSSTQVPHAAVADRVWSCVRRYGRHTTSFQVLEGGYHYWFCAQGPDREACVSYRKVGRTRVVAGPPLCPVDRLADVTRRFVADAEAAGEEVLFFSVGRCFVRDLCRDPGGLRVDLLRIGSQPVWDPQRYAIESPDHRGLRAQRRRANRRGVRVRRLDPDEVRKPWFPMRQQMVRVFERWASSRKMALMRFLVQVEPFHLAGERRYYVAEQHDRVVAFLVAVPIYRRAGWFFEDVIRDPDAPNGTIELLVSSAIEDARAQGDRLVTLGLAPLATTPGGAGRHRGLRATLRLCHRWFEPLYRFRGLQTFKSRLRPDRWQPQYLVSVGGEIGWRSIAVVLRAFAGQSLWRFGWRSLLRLLPRPIPSPCPGADLLPRLVDPLHKG